MKNSKKPKTTINFTKEEIMYLKKNGLTELDIYDGRGKNRRECHDGAKINGCPYYFGNPCTNGGHRIKTRSGHCAICRPAAIVFQNRYNNGGIIYVAKTKSHTKIGVVDNNIDFPEQAIRNRENRLNLEGGYGGETGWKIIAWMPVKSSVGLIEHVAHGILAQYSTKSEYHYSGERRIAQELLSCSASVAIRTVNSLFNSEMIPRI